MEDFNTLSPNEKLDDILCRLNKYQSNTPKEATQLSFDVFPYDVNEAQRKIPQILSILRHLEKDGYIEHNLAGFIITFSGSFFIENGGYVASATSQKETSDRVQLIEKITLENSARLNDLTFWLVAATVLLFLLEFLKFLLDYNLLPCYQKSP